LRSEQEPSNWYIAKDAAIQPRLLIVGALNQSGSVNSPASIAWYSNTAGADTDIAKRFLLASGTIPFSGSEIAVDGTPLSGGYGTSAAAPRVAGMVAIVRSKFPNLSASQTASIMLDTARYDTLTCYPACDPAIYGRGEASLSRALAPVGKLR
jgi:subtilisin family serine protease